MDLQFTPEEQAFRTEVQEFLKTHLPPALAAKIRAGQRLTRADQEDWHATLNKQGWLAYHWPKEYGGTGWTPIQKFIFDNECALAGGPRLVPFGISMLGPVLIKYGNDAQRKHWLPRILNGEDWWCQGYSEPGAGSDLASLKTSAVRQGDHYVVNGQKTWTTQAQHANMMFCLVRTNRDVKAQRGISFLLIDMKQPGVEVRPIRTLDGDADINEVFLTNVKVPIENLVGEEDKGWTYAKYLLTYERTGIAGVGFCMAALEKLKILIKKVQRNGKPLAEDAQFARRVAQIEIDLSNMATTNLRMLAAVQGGGVPGAESSILKIQGTVIRQDLLALIRRAVGPYALPYIEAAQYAEYDESPLGPPEAATAATTYFNFRKHSIYGGSNEIQRNIISKMILGL